MKVFNNEAGLAEGVQRDADFFRGSFQDNTDRASFFVFRSGELALVEHIDWTAQFLQKNHNWFRAILPPGFGVAISDQPPPESEKPFVFTLEALIEFDNSSFVGAIDDKGQLHACFNVPITNPDASVFADYADEILKDLNLITIPAVDPGIGIPHLLLANSQAYSGLLRNSVDPEPVVVGSFTGGYADKDILKLA